MSDRDERVILWRCPTHGLTQATNRAWDGSHGCPVSMADDEACCAPLAGPLQYVPTVGPSSEGDA